MKSHIRAIAVLALALLGAACADTPVEPSATDVAGLPAAKVGTNGVQRTIEEYMSDLTGIEVEIACEDGSSSERVALFGQVYNRNTLLVDGAGGIHYRAHSMPVGVYGIGLESGATYRVKEQLHESANQTRSGASILNRYRFELVNQETKEKYLLWYTLIVREQYRDGGAEFVVEREEVRASCGA